MKVMSLGHEAEIISGKRRSDPSSNTIFRFVNRFQQLPTAPVGRVVCEGDVIAAGFRIVSTSGHALGYTSFLRDEDDLLFTADAFGALTCRIRIGVQKAFCTLILHKRDARSRDTVSPCARTHAGSSGKQSPVVAIEPCGEPVP